MPCALSASSSVMPLRRWCRLRSPRSSIGRFFLGDACGGCPARRTRTARSNASPWSQRTLSGLPWNMATYTAAICLSPASVLSVWTRAGSGQDPFVRHHRPVRRHAHQWATTTVTTCIGAGRCHAAAFAGATASLLLALNRPWVTNPDRAKSYVCATTRGALSWAQQQSHLPK